MDKKRLIKMSGNPQFISGIYNYCDRWCERCYLASRCLLYVREQEEQEELVEEEYSQEEFWENMSANFSAIIELINENAENWGVALDDDLEYLENSIIQQHDWIRNQPLIKQARNYFLLAHDWLQTFEDHFLDHNGNLIGLESCNKSLYDAVELEIILKDAYEVISWYHIQIEVKLSRAINSKVYDVGHEPPAGFPKDEDGSAKVALIGMDLSMEAWKEMIHCFSDISEEKSNIIEHLKKLIEMTETEFPDARNCIRPGFDTFNQI
jgi:hypothetical protein